MMSCCQCNQQCNHIGAHTYCEAHGGKPQGRTWISNNTSGQVDEISPPKPTITYEIVGNTENVTPDFRGMWTCPRCVDKHVIGSAHACKPVLSKTEPEDDPTLTQQEVDEIAEQLKIQRAEVAKLDIEKAIRVDREILAGLVENLFTQSVWVKDKDGNQSRSEFVFKSDVENLLDSAISIREEE